MTRDEARWLSRHEVSETDENGPDPTEDPISYLQEGRKEAEETKK